MVAVSLTLDGIPAISQGSNGILHPPQVDFLCFSRPVSIEKEISDINALEPIMAAMSDDELRDESVRLKIHALKLSDDEFDHFW